MKKFTFMVLGLLAGATGSFAQCLDWNEYVDHKNVSGTGYHTLEVGQEEYAAQTYHYSGPGEIRRIEIEGDYDEDLPWWGNYIYLQIGVYNVDANNRPTTPIWTTTDYWSKYEMSNTYNLSESVNDDFAVVVRIMPSSYNPNGKQFKVMMTGAGEGNNEDLSSTAGTSTGGNWISLLPGDDYDFYMIPRMQHLPEADFSVTKECNVAVGETLTFSDNSDFSQDPMFNTITLGGYTGSETLYHWDFGDGQTSTMQNPTHSYSNPGVYTVELTTTIDTWPMGGDVCTDTKSVEISVGLEVNGSPTHLSCNGDGSGEIAFAGAGGAGNYEYSIDGSNWHSSPITGLDAGTYSIWVRDDLGCVESGNAVTVNEPTAVSIAEPVVTTATCGNADGALTFSASGGTGAITYSIDGSNYQSAGTFSNLSAGGYTLYAKDANGCEEMAHAVVTSTDSPDLTLQSYTTVSCNGGNDGSITLIGSGGTGALEYSIDGGQTFQASGSFTSVSAGTYAPLVKDAAGCIGQLDCGFSIISCGTVTITEPEELNFAFETTPTSCNNGTNGSIEVTLVTGGTGNATYSLNGTNYQSNSTFNNLSAGSYSVYTKDAAGCVATLIANVDEPSAIAISVDNVIDLSCFESGDGEIHVSATGGVGEYEYSLDGGDFISASDYTDLDAGTYSIVVSDANGCQANTSATVNQPTEIQAAITEGASTCGNATGTILAVANGGSGSGYSYSLDGGSTTNGTGSFSSLAGGDYIIWVEDGDGCVNVFDAQVADSDGPTIGGTATTDVSCFGGDNGTIEITSMATGTAPFQYSVDGGAQQSSNILTGLDAGDHTVLIEDAAGCLVDVTLTINEPSAIVVTLNGTDASCFGGDDGAITAAAGGGTGALAYDLNGGGFVSTSTFDDLTAGNYIVTVKDALQCLGSASITIGEPTEIDLTVAYLDVTCNGADNGQISATATGGTGTIEFSLDQSAWTTNGQFIDLPGDDYFVYARDANGCIVQEALTIDEPHALLLVGQVSDVSCAGGDDGVIDLTVTGGTPGYMFQWSNFQQSEDAFNLSEGTYTVDVMDANGCLASDSYIVDEPSNPIIVNGTVTNASSGTGSDGTVDITVTGGTPPYTFAWSNGATTEDLSQLSPGVYVVTVSDANGCESTTSYTVNFTVGLDENGEEFTLSVYPNPASNVVNIELSNDVIADQLVILDISGKVVYNEIPQNSDVEIDVAFMAEGVYFVNIYAGKEVITKKLVINKQ
jgi:hypothetical protein